MKWVPRIGVSVPHQSNSSEGGWRETYDRFDEKESQLGLVPTPVATAPSLDSRVALIQALIPVALEQVHAALQAEVVGLAGERYAREGRQPGHVRWTPQAGSIYLADIPIAVPRVRTGC